MTPSLAGEFFRDKPSSILTITNISDKQSGRKLNVITMNLQSNISSNRLVINSNPSSRPPTTPSIESSSPPPRSRQSTRSFTSLAPSDSRSNYNHSNDRYHHNRLNSVQSIHRSPMSSLKLDPSKRSHNYQNDHHHLIQSSKSTIPIGTRPDDIDLLSIDDPDDLFVNFTIREIRSIEQRARTDANQKQEDLRQMVGERYRDLLGAADSIVRMKTSSEKLLERLDLARLESDTNLLRSRASTAGNSHTRSMNGSSKLLYSLATLVKLLLDLSEHIWRSLEREDFLTAARYESLGRIISNELTSGKWDETGETKPSEVIEMFPIVERQSETLSQLSPQISFRAKNFLKKWESKPQAILQALAAIVLLDNTNFLDSLYLFLQVRKTTLNTLIKRLTGPWTEQVKNSAKLVLATLTQVENIFLNGQFIDFLKAIQDGSSKEKHLKPLLSLLPNAHQLMRHIPRSIIDFSPFVTALTESSPQFEPLLITKKWFEDCQSELISYINRKLDQIKSTQSLVEFSQKLQQVIIEQPSGHFKPSIQSFESQIIDCLNKRFYELYRSKLNQLKDRIVKVLNPPSDHLQRTPPVNSTLDEIKNDRIENWIFDTKLPSLESNDPAKFTKYLASIQSRIEGKLIMDEKTTGDKHHDLNPSSIFSQMEAVGKLLRQDYYSWKDAQTDSTQTDDSKATYVDLGMQFVKDCLLEINQVLNQEMEKSNIEKELRIGDLALQMLATRNSFMVNLSLIHEGNDGGREHDLIRTFQTGLNQIIFDSSAHWSQFIVDQSIQIFKSKIKSTFIEKHHYFDLVSTPNNEARIVARPSDSIFDSLEFISTSLIKSLGVHRLKSQQVKLLNRLINQFIFGILDDEFVRVIEQQSPTKLDDHQLSGVLDSILFDLNFLLDFFYPSFLLNQHSLNGSGSILNSDVVKKIQDLIDLIFKEIVKEEEKEKRMSKLQIIMENVNRFKSTIVRLWWPLIVIQADLDQETLEGDELDKQRSWRKDYYSNFNLLSSTTNASTTITTLAKLPKLGGLRCVKPGNRFGLLSVY